MTEPSLTGQWKALVARHGNIKLALAGLRHYWKLIAGTAAVLVGCGVFLNKFDTLIEGQKRYADKQQQMSDAITTLVAQQSSLKSDLTVLNQRQVSLETNLGTLFNAAKITVTPIPTENAPPQEARQGKVKR